MNIARVRDLREANEYSLVQLNARLNTEETRLAVEIYNKVMKANYLNSSTRYQQRINEAIANISPTKGAIAQGPGYCSTRRHSYRANCQYPGKPGRSAYA